MKNKIEFSLFKAIDQKQKGNYRIRVVDTFTNLDSDKVTLKPISGISLLYNFFFEDDDVRVWKAFGIGPGT